MKLYFNYLSPFSQKTLVGLYEKNVSFSPEIVNVGDPEARAAYKKIYPLGKVPLLALDDGYLIPESSIILEYVDTHFTTGTKLLPADPDLSRRTRFFDRQFDLYVTDPALTLFFAGDRPGVPPTDPHARETRRIENAQNRLRQMYDYLDHHFTKNTWTMGDDFSLADCAAVPLLTARRIVPIDDRKALNAYVNRLAERPSVARVLKEAAPYLAKAMEGK